MSRIAPPDESHGADLQQAHWRDVATLEAMVPIFEEYPEFVEATPGVRIEFTADGNLSTFPPGLGALLVRTYDLIAPELTFYGAEAHYHYDENMAQHPLGFPESRKRRPKPTDRDNLGRIEALMAEAEAASLGQEQRLHVKLVAMGEEPAPEFFDTVQDGGSLCLADAFPTHLSGSHIMFSGSMPWRFSLSFSLPCWRANAAAIMDLARDLAQTGCFDSGCLGFALNTGESGNQDVAERFFRPMTNRFPLLTIGNPLDMKLTDRNDERWGKRGWLYPPGAWSFIARRKLERYGIDPEALRGLAGQVASVEEFEHAFLIRLWDWPLLGDLSHGADLAPARALARAIAPALRLPNAEGLVESGLSGIEVGSEADLLAWYQRFLTDAESGAE